MAEDNWLDLYRKTSSRLLLFARQYVSGLQDAEDVLQEAFVKFWKNREEGLDEERQVARLYGCVRWVALDWLRRNGRRVKREDAASNDASLREGDTLFECPVDEEERVKAMQDALLQLPEAQREVVALKVWSGLTFDAIGEALDISPNTAASRYRYALAALRTNMNLCSYARNG
ncbi:MAG: RNA polymerase sigma factor [Verrucomicrobiota bacterium]